VNPVFQDSQSYFDLLCFDTSKWSNCFEKPLRMRLVFDQPLPAFATGSNLADAKLIAQPRHVRLTQLGCFDPHANAIAESLCRMAFEEGHDGSISIDESSKVGLLDFGNRLSHGVNHTC
jgi:hypothetical protein